MADKDFKVIQLDNNNWVVWKWQFKNCLKAKKYMNAEGVVSNDAAALALLGNALSQDNITLVVIIKPALPGSSHT